MKSNQTKQKFLLCLIGLICSLSAFSRDSEPGYDFTIGGIYYAYVNAEQKTVAVSYKAEVDPDYGPNYYVSGYSGNVSIPSSVIYNSVTYKVVAIGEHAFDDSSITSVSIPNTVETIGTQAFVDCVSLQSIVIPNSVKSIGRYAFYGCTSLRTITLSNQLTSLSGFLFKDCRSLSSVSIPQSVVTIGENAFNGCTGLTSISISNTVSTIESLAFSGCSKLASIVIPSSVKSIAGKIFNGCTSLTSITVDNNPVFDSRDNCNAIINTSTNTLVAGCKSSNIPNSVIGVGESAFYGIVGMQSVVIPNNIKTIGAYAFANCQLQEVTIGSSVTSIGQYAFGYIYETNTVYGTDRSFNYTEEPVFTSSSLSLKKVTSNIQEPYAISENVFNGIITYQRGEWRGDPYCEGCEPSYYQEQVTKTVFPDASLTVPLSAIDKYENLSAWNKFSSIVESGFTDGYIFTKEVNGTKLTLKILSIEEKAIQVGNEKEPAIPTEASAILVIPSTIILDGSTYKVVRIAESAFKDCGKINTVEIPSCIISIGNDAFSNCSGLQKLIVSDLSSWCNITFGNKYSNPLYYAKHLYKDATTEITDLVIPDGVPNIGAFTFVKGSFKSVKIPGCVAQIGSSSFYKCLSMTSLHLAEGVEYIRSNAFYGCTALKSVVFPNTVYRLGGSAFYGCTALESIELPIGLIGSGDLTGVGDNAFNGCSNLKKVTSNTLSPTALGIDAFAGVSADCVLYIPVGKLTAYYKGGWTKDVFGGGIVEVGDVVENFFLENGVTSEFIKNVTYPNDDYSYTKITDYTTQATSYRKDLPMPVVLEVPLTNEGEALILETYAEGLMARSDTFLVGQRALEIWNLIPQTSYTYKLYILNSDKTKKEILGGSFETIGQVRMMKIDNVRNFRDIGGWKLPNGRSIKYDKIFRCAELATSSQLITPSGINELLKVQGIEVEIDFGDYSSASPVEDYLEFVHGDNYQLTFYADGAKNRKAQYKNCFEKVVNSLREGKKLIFHCSAGADRTGGFAFLLEGLLGVSESDLAKDYELTSFYLDKRYRTTDGVGYKGLIDYVKNTFSGNTINEKIEQMALTSFGISQKDINDFRSLMYECNTLSASDVIIAKGKTAQMSVYMDNLNEISAFQFFVKVPKGVTLTDAVLTERKSSSHSVQYIKQDDGLYKVVGVSTSNELFSGNDGKLVNLKLSASNDMELGNYDVMVKDILLTTPTQQKFRPSNISAVLSVLEYLEGDADGDGVIDVADIVAMVNSIMGQPSPNFVKKAADLNGDGEVDIFDVMLAINLVLNQKGSNGSKTRGADIDNALQMMDMMRANDGIKLNIANAERYSAFQFDVEVPDGTELTEARLIGSEDTHLIKFDQIGENHYKVMSVSLNNSPLKVTADGLLSLSLSNNSGCLAMIDNIKFVTPEGEKVYFAASHENSATAIKEIGIEKEEMIHDMSGRKVTYSRESLPKGIYIINNKKVVIK